MSKKTHNDYWIARALEVFRYADRKDVSFFAEMEQAYRNQAVALQKAVFSFYSKYAEDNHISYQEAVQRLRGEDLSDYQANAALYRSQAEKDPELLKRLNAQYSAAKATRLETLHAEIVYRMGLLTGILHKKFEDYLKDVAKHAYQKSMGGRTGAANWPGLDEVLRTPFNGRNYSQQLWGNTDALAQKLEQVLKQGFIRGDGPQEMASEIRKSFNVARSRAETLIRTDATAIINRATVSRYKEAGLKYYRILVILDSRTTVICRNIASEDKLYLLEEAQSGVTMPPFHHNCRSTIMPDEEELNTEVKPIKGETADEEAGLKRLYRNKDQNKRRPINIVRQNKLTQDFRKRGGFVWQDDEAQKYLNSRKAAAMNLDAKTIVLQKRPTISEVLEELFHAEQWRNGRLVDDPISKIKAEIEAQKYLLSVEKRYNIPRGETEQTKRNLKFWEEELKKYEN